MKPRGLLSDGEVSGSWLPVTVNDHPVSPAAMRGVARGTNWKGRAEEDQALRPGAVDAHPVSWQPWLPV